MAAGTVEPNARECANCGAIEGLLRCSRCRNAYFCSIKCQKAIWPFHRQECVRNEFADAVEETEPKFAAWMRKHGKQAVLKDDEVDRLERAGKASTGFSRNEVMDSMYGRLKPSPKEATYTAEERKLMQVKEDHEKAKARGSRKDEAWEAIAVDPLLGMECAEYKWQQNQSYVEVFCHLPEGTTLKETEVVLRPDSLAVVVRMRPVLRGALFARVKVDESTWFLEGRVLTLVLLKSSRRGCYQDGTTNADTFWKSVLKTPQQGECLEVLHPPSSYYSSFWEEPQAGSLQAQPSARRLAAKA